MKFSLTLSHLAQIIEANNDRSQLDSISELCIGVSTDTRSIKTGDVFVALEGENFDGHNFIAQAVEKGAIAVIVREDYTDDRNVIKLNVKDTLKAYQDIAHWWRTQLDIPIIGITGSVGKTTTKELISGVLSTKGKVHKTEANYNNEIGVPKTLLQIDETHKYAVIEMAMRGRGEIALLTDIVKPDIAVITNVGTAHIGRLGSREAIAEAKCELLANMDDTSVAILNSDNDLLISTAKTVWQGKTITYGLNSGEIKGELVDANTVQVAEDKYKLPLTGEHNALNYLSAIAIAQILELDLATIQQGVEVNMPKGRAKIYELENDVQVLDETYNAGFESMTAALRLLKQTEGKRRIAVLGTMKELGEFSPQLHQQVGETVKELGLYLLLVLVDEEATKSIAEGAVGTPQEIFTSHDDLLAYLKENTTSGDRILFKASNSVGLSKIVEQFIA